MRSSRDEISSRVERLLTAQPAAPSQARRVRRAFPLARVWEEGPRYLGVEVTVDGEFAECHRRPGQYVTMKLDGWPARFFVLANQPGNRRWELLVDRESESGRLLGERDQDVVLMSMPEGVGFDAGEGAGKEALLFCTGSGIATIRPLVEGWLEGPEEDVPGQISLFVGESRAEDFAYEERVKRWEAQGVRVRRAVERGDEEGAFPFRYVQHAFDACPRPVTDAYAYLSGAPVMIQMVATMLMQRGMSPGRLKINV